MCRMAMRSLIGIVLMELASVIARAQQEDVAAASKISYRQYCASCHGLDGKGSGEMATLLKVKPANLTRLSAKHDGRRRQEGARGHSRGGAAKGRARSGGVHDVRDPSQRHPG